MVLETDRLLLKSSSCDFAPALLAYYKENRAFLEEFEPQREDSFYTLDAQQAILKNDIRLEEEKSSFRFYLFPRESPHVLIGSVALSNIVWGCFLSCFMGCKLSEANVNKGYMTEAVQKVVEYAFATLKLHRIEGNVMPKNKPSLQVLHKCGFVSEGLSPKYLKINGKWEDHLHLVLLNETAE